MLLRVCPDLKSWNTGQEAYFYFARNRLLTSLPAENISHRVPAGCFLSSLWNCYLVSWRLLCSRASWFLVFGEQLFHVIVTQLIIGLSHIFIVCQLAGFEGIPNKEHV
jgi:hypothetical protein